MSEATLAESHAVVAHSGDDHGADDHGAHMVTSTGLSNNKLAMWLFLGSECLIPY